MPASGNAVWAPGDAITATKLQNIESALTASLAKGANNQATDEILGFLIPIDTRSWTATTWDATYTDKPTHIDVKDGATTVATLDITYNGYGNPTQVVAVAGGKTITYTISWTGTKFTGYTKAVV